MYLFFIRVSNAFHTSPAQNYYHSGRKKRPLTWHFNSTLGFYCMQVFDILKKTSIEGATFLLYNTYGGTWLKIFTVMLRILWFNYQSFLRKESLKKKVQVLMLTKYVIQLRFHFSEIIKVWQKRENLGYFLVLNPNVIIAFFKNG